MYSSACEETPPLNVYGSTTDIVLENHCHRKFTLEIYFFIALWGVLNKEGKNKNTVSVKILMKEIALIMRVWCYRLYSFKYKSKHHIYCMYSILQ